ncbi:6444_t:CDS:2, partial [Paraglomus occultum]
WSYPGYLEAMQPYFNDSKLKSLKSVWKRRFNEQLKKIIKDTDEERSKAASDLINKKESSNVVEFWDLFEKRRLIKRQQISTKQLSTLRVMSNAATYQENELKRQSDNYLERGKSKSCKTSIEDSHQAESSNGSYRLDNVLVIQEDFDGNRGKENFQDSDEVITDFLYLSNQEMELHSVVIVIRLSALHQSEP